MTEEMLGEKPIEEKANEGMRRKKEADQKRSLRPRVNTHFPALAIRRTQRPQSSRMPISQQEPYRTKNKGGQAIRQKGERNDARISTRPLHFSYIDDHKKSPITNHGMMEKTSIIIVLLHP